MKAITLRNVPPEVARRIERKSQELGLSLNKTVLRLLEERLIPGSARPVAPERHRDLDDLAGAWSQEEADEFDAALAEQRRIDPELWD